LDKLAPKRPATGPAERQRPRQGAEIVGGEVSSSSSLRRRAMGAWMLNSDFG